MRYSCIGGEDNWQCMVCFRAVTRSAFGPLPETLVCPAHGAHRGWVLDFAARRDNGTFQMFQRCIAPGLATYPNMNAEYATIVPCQSDFMDDEGEIPNGQLEPIVDTTYSGSIDDSLDEGETPTGQPEQQLHPWATLFGQPEP